VQVRGDLVLAPLLPLALETREPLAEARREASLDVVRRGEQTVHAFLVIDRRAHPVPQQTDERAAYEGDERSDDPLVARRVVDDVVVERLGERADGVLHVVGEETPASREVGAQERLDIGAVHAALALTANALAHLGEDRVEVDGSFRHRASLLTRATITAAS